VLPPIQIAGVVAIAAIVGNGLIVILKVVAGPVHPLAVAVTLTIAVPGFVEVNGGILPVPLVPKPTFIVLVQE
jgi:hypothetical protein